MPIGFQGFQKGNNDGKGIDRAGIHNGMYGKKQSDAAKIKIGLKSKGRIPNKKTRLKLSLAGIKRGIKQQGVKMEKYKKKYPLGYRATKLRSTYGISLDDYNDILVRQEYKCAICETTTPGGMGCFPIDHDHKTGKIRGLLCNRCNTALGSFHDSEDILLKAIIYLKQNNGN